MFFRASALPVWPIATSVPPVFPTPPPGLWSGPRDASSSVHVVAGHPEDTRSRSHNHHICVFANPSWNLSISTKLRLCKKRWGRMEENIYEFPLQSDTAYASHWASKPIGNLKAKASTASLLRGETSVATPALPFYLSGFEWKVQEHICERCGQVMESGGNSRHSSSGRYVFLWFRTGFKPVKSSYSYFSFNSSVMSSN